jgi:hypothetical protein
MENFQQANASQELRLGNYLLYDGRVVIVSMLSIDIREEFEKLIGFCYLDNLSNEYYGNVGQTIDKLNPIPLTPEWLNRFNIKFGEALGYGYPFGDNSNLYLTKRIFNAVECSIMITSDGEEVFSHIKHVHQLQNIYFALTGKELEIKT